MGDPVFLQFLRRFLLQAFLFALFVAFYSGFPVLLSPYIPSGLRNWRLGVILHIFWENMVEDRLVMVLVGSLPAFIPSLTPNPLSLLPFCTGSCIYELLGRILRAILLLALTLMNLKIVMIYFYVLISILFLI